MFWEILTASFEKPKSCVPQGLGFGCPEDEGTKRLGALGSGEVISASPVSSLRWRDVFPTTAFEWIKYSLWFKVGVVKIKLIRQWFVASRCCWITTCPKAQWLKAVTIYYGPPSPAIRVKMTSPEGLGLAGDWLAHRLILFFHKRART